MLHQAVILAGGLGTRLGALTHTTPKPLLPVGGIPFLEHVVWNLKRHGIRDILFSIGYRAERIVEHFGDGSGFGVAIDYVIEQSPAGTGGALLLCRDKLQERFLMLNGDTLFDINFLDLALMAQEEGALACLALRHVPQAGRYGRVDLQGRRVAAFVEKSDNNPGLISGGISVLAREILEYIPGAPSSLEKDVMPRLAAEGGVSGKAYSGFFLDIGLPETLAEAQTTVPAWRCKPALLMDRDGVINVDYGYVHTPEQFCWIPGAPEAIKAANDAGWLTIVVTNQAGIARGYYTEDEFHAFMHYINGMLRERGAHLDAWYFCPHHPTEGKGAYRQSCDCRKPRPGMIQQALKEWGFDPHRSLIVGDKPFDLEAGAALGIPGILFAGKPDNLLELLMGSIPPKDRSEADGREKIARS